uniref:Uncharacterized protein n=1 Tax=Chromera velia CCMP2878 TaxID=1169474 RepID=A0A0G4HUN9_9ALVE|eukprot:Cvel_31923.t1-p1 / transcript=Cvel_31923.t1 / gene=Cvel_31923 / organism=Chromera_velia_CCMP2878 / gene_product=hypothetical protein / transcript_product=hypothetical protein / location=Cvel_scaffold4851:4279-5889(+) / protein_length=537 / sequence_SO=supercontig / SO=protein_coding / is_pseudo=false
MFDLRVLWALIGLIFGVCVLMVSRQPDGNSKVTREKDLLRILLRQNVTGITLPRQNVKRGAGGGTGGVSDLFLQMVDANGAGGTDVSPSFLQMNLLASLQKGSVVVEVGGRNRWLSCFAADMKLHVVTLESNPLLRGMGSCAHKTVTAGAANETDLACDTACQTYGGVVWVGVEADAQEGEKSVLWRDLVGTSRLRIPTDPLPLFPSVSRTGHETETEMIILDRSEWRCHSRLVHRAAPVTPWIRHLRAYEWFVEMGSLVAKKGPGGMTGGGSSRLQQKKAPRAHQRRVQRPEPVGDPSYDLFTFPETEAPVWTGEISESESQALACCLDRKETKRGGEYMYECVTFDSADLCEAALKAEETTLPLKCVEPGDNERFTVQTKSLDSVLLQGGESPLGVRLKLGGKGNEGAGISLLRIDESRASDLLSVLQGASNLLRLSEGGPLMIWFPLCVSMLGYENAVEALDLLLSLKYDVYELPSPPSSSKSKQRVQTERRMAAEGRWDSKGKNRGGTLAEWISEVAQRELAGDITFLLAHKQ